MGVQLFFFRGGSRLGLRTDCMQYEVASLERAVLALYHDPSRAREANEYLLAFQNSDAAWHSSAELLRSSHANVVLFAACCLHQKAKASARELSPAELRWQCEQLCSAIAAVPHPPVRAQLCLATALIAAALYPADADVGADCPGPAAVVYGADGPARELPAALQVQILTALPQACPHHHEQLRSSLFAHSKLCHRELAQLAVELGLVGHSGRRLRLGRFA